MAFNETKRKRSVPEWMKSPKKPSPAKGLDNSKGNVSSGLKTQRPSYPPISIKKTKQILKPVEGCRSGTEMAGPSGAHGVHPVNDDPQSVRSPSSKFGNEFSANNVTAEELDAFVMTVEDFTQVAEEIIKEEHQKRASLVLSRIPPKPALS